MTMFIYKPGDKYHRVEIDPSYVPPGAIYTEYNSPDLHAFDTFDVGNKIFTYSDVGQNIWVRRVESIAVDGPRGFASMKAERLGDEQWTFNKLPYAIRNAVEPNKIDFSKMTMDEVLKFLES